MNEKLKKRKLPIIIVLFGFFLMIIMSVLKSEPKKKEEIKQAPLVEYILAKPQEIQLKIKSSGTVHSKAEIMLMPQVTGVIVKRSEKMSVGALFKKGELLYQIDSRDYRYQAEVAYSKVLAKKLDMEKEEQEARIAKEELKLFQKENPNETVSSLASREPQLALQRANLKSAEAQYGVALLNVKRTEIRAPFDGVVQTKLVDVGQFVSPGASMGEIVSTEEAEIPIYFSPEKRFFLEKGKISTAFVSQITNGEKRIWKGELRYDGGSLDTKNRLIGLTVKVKNPYDREYPLLIGSYVKVSLLGKSIKHGFMIPSSAVRENRTIWLVTSENKLEVRSVTVVKFQGEQAIISEGLKADERIIVSNLVYHVDGMEVQAEAK